MAEGIEKQLGKYVLKSQLGHGGMGVVYLATDTRLKRDVAIKILPRHLSSSEEALARFTREAHVVAQLNHPHVVIIHDVDHQLGYSFLVMELLTGGTMQQAIARGPLPWIEATNVIMQACRGLAAAHDAGLIHRDIKPSNLMRAANGIVKLTDFGLAKMVQETQANPVTKSGTVVGTPHYMSPEQCRGEALDARSDLYALGATYYTLLVGEPPFTDDQSLQVMFAHCSKPAPDPCRRQPDVAEGCGHIVLKAMAKNRAQRFGSAKEMLAALDELIVTMPTEAIVGSRSAAVPVARLSTSSAEDLLPTLKFRPESAAMPGVAPAAPQALPVALHAPTQSAPTSRRRRLISIAAAACLLLATLLLVWNLFKETDKDAHKSHAIRIEQRAELPVAQTPIRSVAFSADGKSLFCSAPDEAIQQWDCLKAKPIRRYTGAKGNVLAVAANARWLAAGGQGKTVWLWKYDSIDPVDTLAGFAGEISAIAFSPDGHRLAVGTYADVRLYELHDKGARLLKVLGVSSSEPACYMVMSVTFSADSRMLAATTWANKRVFLWNAATGALRHSGPELDDNPMAVAFIPGRDDLLIGLQSRGLARWDVDKGKVTMLEKEAAPTRSISLSPDGHTVVAVGDWGGNIRILDLALGAPPQVVPRATAASAVTVAFSPTGAMLAFGGGGGDGSGPAYLHLFDVVQGKQE